MTWTTPADLRGQVHKLWDSGRMLAVLAGGEELFPRKLRLKKPTSAEMSARFTEVRDWIGRLQEEEKNYRLAWRRIQHRTLGANDVPAEAWIDSLEDGLTLIGKTGEAQAFAKLVTMAEEQQPLLVSWLAKRPLKALALADQWEGLLAVVSWLQCHPRPGIYLRQVDIKGVHSKFIERHRTVLAELLDLVLPPQHIIVEAASGAAGFCRRYGFRDKPVRIRFRLLDPAVPLLPVGKGVSKLDQDIAVTGAHFAALDLACTDIFITENEINFLSFPQRPGSIVIFGAGYGFDVLAGANWLYSCRIHYWGDIDTHGFAILDQLRTFFPKANSFLMDRETFFAHQVHWAEEPQPTSCDLARLTPEENSLYDDLRYGHLGKRLRLEQERVGFSWLEKALARL